jgi:hypothetical protein
MNSVLFFIVFNFICNICFYQAHNTSCLSFEKKIFLATPSIKSTCDTIKIEDFYDIINANKLKRFQLIKIDTTQEDIIINSRKRVKNLVRITDMIKYTSYNGYAIGPDNDYEYFTLNDQVLYVDLLYNSMMSSSYNFRSADGLSAYEFDNSNYKYIAVFIKNSWPLIGHGYSLFLFCNKNNTDRAELILVSKDQIAPDMRCFGLDEKDNSLIYYDWDYGKTMHSDRRYYIIYKVNENRIEFIDQINIDINPIDNWRITFCK